MSEKNIFPPEWNWERYEPAVREWMAQRARVIEWCAKPPIKKVRLNHTLSELWRREQEDKGLLPPEEQTQSEECIACIERVLEKAQEHLTNGRLKNGLDHIAQYEKIRKDPDSAIAETVGVDDPDEYDRRKPLVARMAHNVENFRLECEIRIQDHVHRRRRRR